MINSELEKIFECVDSKKSFCFNAGAGSGKTYSLVKTIAYIVEKYGGCLRKRKQRIMVITFTNSAANEIQRRLGKSELVAVSTIHERLWEIIKKFQKDLIDCHSEKLNSELDKCNECISDSVFECDQVLKDNLFGLSKDYFQSLFWKKIDLKAPQFKEVMSPFVSQPITNVSEFKAFVKACIKRDRYLKAIDDLKNKKAPTVKYNPLVNVDRLHKMEFSHDTLLEYASKIIISNNTISRIVGNAFPYILIDEFQDTNPSVIDILFHISNSKEVVTGFYGDVMQNIYDAGSGKKVVLNDALVLINKPENHRSSPNVVEIGNRIRDDELKQISMVNDVGKNEIYYYRNTSISNFEIDSFVASVMTKITKGTTTACLLLKNDLVAAKMGFGTFFDLITSTNYYKKNRDQVNSEILSDDAKQLGKVPLFLLKLIKLCHFIEEKQGHRVVEVIHKSILSSINHFELLKVLEKLESIRRTTIMECLDDLCSLDDEKGTIKSVINNYFRIDDISDYRSYMFDALFSQIDETDEEKANELLNSILNLSLSEIGAWFKYVSRQFDENQVYLTLHNSKGLEFDNVIVVLTNLFNRKTDYFHSYFLDMKNDENNYKRNLLYVAVTRAKRNLYMLYCDSDFDAIKESFQSIFGDEIIEIELSANS